MKHSFVTMIFNNSLENAKMLGHGYDQIILALRCPIKKENEENNASNINNSCKACRLNCCGCCSFVTTS